MGDYRRVDDLVDENGEPISAAHQAIYQHISQCKEDILADRGRISSEAVADHVKLHHHTALSEIATMRGTTPGDLMAEFLANIDNGARIVDALEGPEEERLDGTFYRIKEKGMLFKVDDIMENQRNGIKHKAELTKAQWAFATGLIGSLATIAVALIMAA